ncbi:MAG: putative membrane protein [Psychromonas sp.]|jgi:uncharacterized membrane protein|uniref:hypothetical protein n=1 Tax=Psychromonas sp. TaxID=1884585 RepID=UPI0039E68A2A
MLRTNFISLLLLIWRLSTVFIFPVIIYFYLHLMTFYTDGFTFQQLDQGSNMHKGAVVVVYVIYLLIWKSLNKKVNDYLKKFEYS